ncbi:uncharacterized protein B0I36DRAFT_414487 [Microdochium trichocladiopsis]|uniref:Uncharacterized protein n=1 Tax=Microdochium trichocladiopsis TaxID=1682393 RepID=A0A9P8XZP7_9PEZI|nr:uncharacterized protein B0I36DRAFT_414487 [Microdochium trichocladiopsis]KAH7026134.1 hypothetical protein B0I36DRAFT_414487 [Microdochium trichocladiopsis]
MAAADWHFSVHDVVLHRSERTDVHGYLYVGSWPASHGPVAKLPALPRGLSCQDKSCSGCGYLLSERFNLAPYSAREALTCCCTSSLWSALPSEARDLSSLGGLGAGSDLASLASSCADLFVLIGERESQSCLFAHDLSLPGVVQGEERSL